jgi:hypothetical protein
LWKSWAPPKCIFFLWLAIRNKCWTSDILERRGLDHPKSCLLCDQTQETIQHLLCMCVFVRQFWHTIFSPLGFGNLSPSGDEISFANWWRKVSAFRPRGVPGPTSKLSLRVPARMGRRETEHKGGRDSKGKPQPSCCPAPRADALAVVGYKRSRGREREPCASARSPARPPSRTRALDLPFIGIRRGPRCTMGV